MIKSVVEIAAQIRGIRGAKVGCVRLAVKSAVKNKSWTHKRDPNITPISQGCKYNMNNTQVGG